MSEIRKLPAAEPRVESGPVQFGDDWPGTFIRGDNAGWYSFLLGQLLEDEKLDLLSKMNLTGLARLLGGCVLGPAAGMLPQGAPPADWQAKVREFHVKFGCKHADTPVSEMDLRTVALRNSLHEEEIKELRKAMYNVDLVEIADALADSIYVLLGTAVTYGIDLAPIFAEVHRTNMAKDGGATRADGKILKPEGWQPPDIAGLIEKQRSRGEVADG